ncbi:unnamed protein product [Orchesella dallaii]|uniref:Uncharacterized protein n=1 Tax=Orchesella dallaii TaxID=48710 RepID=A0ABP1Q1E6_9HEXA
MNLLKFLTIFIVPSILLVVQKADSQSSASCGIAGIVEGSDDNRHAIPLVSDYLVNRTLIWQPRLEGKVTRTTAVSNDHFKYIDATNTQSYYRMYSNDLTRYFPRDMKIRAITRDVIVRCEDGTSSTYFLKVPLQDMTPPEFTDELYTFHITSDWNVGKPISAGKFVIVNDNDYELENDPPKMLSFQTTPADVLEVQAQRLWVAANPEKYFYRLDIFLKDDPNNPLIPLTVGRTEVKLSALDDFNAGFTTIEIIVE